MLKKKEIHEKIVATCKQYLEKNGYLVVEKNCGLCRNWQIACNHCEKYSKFEPNKH